MNLSILKKRLLGLFFPRHACCMGCGSWLGNERRDLCEDCRRSLAERFIGLRMPAKRTGLSGAAYAHPYHGPASGIVRRLKYHRVNLLAGPMSADIARAANLLRLKGDVIITFVPMHPRRLRTRDQNHAEVLARRVAALMDMPCADLLLRTRNAPQQARLSREERLVNLKDAFAAIPEKKDIICGSTILLVDDVWTTGATAVSCTKALRDAGAAKVYFAAYAFGERE